MDNLVRPNSLVYKMSYLLARLLSRISKPLFHHTLKFRSFFLSTKYTGLGANLPTTSFSETPPKLPIFSLCFSPVYQSNIFRHPHSRTWQDDELYSSMVLWLPLQVVIIPDLQEENQLSLINI